MTQLRMNSLVLKTLNGPDRVISKTNRTEGKAEKNYFVILIVDIVSFIKY